MLTETNFAGRFIFFSFMLSSCSFLKEIATLGKCEFRVTTLENPTLAGIDVSDISSLGDFGFADMGILTASIMKGILPLDFTLNIEARNPNPATAAMNRLEYIALIDDVQIALRDFKCFLETAPQSEEDLKTAQ